MTPDADRILVDGEEIIVTKVTVTQRTFLTPDELWVVAQEVCTDRQVECLRLVAQGYSEREISRRLGVSRSTVRSHLESAAMRVRRAVQAA